MRFENGKRMVAMAVLLISSAVSAAPLSLWPGQSELLGLQRKIAKITVSDTDVVMVVRQRVGAELRAKAPGIAHVEMRTTDGFVFDFDVHVTPRAEVYSVNRAESEHAGFSLEGYKPGEKPAARASAPKAPPAKEQARRPTKSARGNA